MKPSERLNEIEEMNSENHYTYNPNEDVKEDISWLIARVKRLEECLNWTLYHTRHAKSLLDLTQPTQNAAFRALKLANDETLKALRGNE